MPQPRSFLVTILALLVIAVGVGTPMVSLPLFTHLVALVLPGALAIPVGVPALGLPGSEPLVMWGATVIAALVLLIVTARYFRRATTLPTRGAVWRRVVIGVALGLMLANAIRAITWSFYTSPSITIYGVTLLLSVVLSALIGALIGVLVGGIAALAAKPSPVVHK